MSDSISSDNPWSGRFSKQMSDLLVSFNTSLPIETRLFQCDIEGSRAHAMMLRTIGILGDEEFSALDQALDEILADWKAGSIALSASLEDIHMNLENLLIEKVGEAGRKIHTARSRNDQQATAQRLYFKESTKELINATYDFEKALLTHCKTHSGIVMPSYTHLQRAEATTYSHWLATYIVMLDRDRRRFIDALNRADECPLGACASTGTSIGIDREQTSSLLGFRAPTLHSIDSVSDRDYLLEFASDASILMIHLSRFSEEIIFFVSQECGFISLDDAYCTGSSIMPQKKNPDVLELVRGKSSTVIGNTATLFSLLKSLPLGYNKDLQEDKTAWFSIVDSALSSVRILTAVVQTMSPNPTKMIAATQSGHILATEYANYLLRKGLSFRDAHQTIGRLVKTADTMKIDVSQLPFSELKAANELFEEDIKEMSVQDLVRMKRSTGACGSAFDEMLKEIEKILERN